MTRYLLDTNMMGHPINRRHGVHEKVRDARRRGAIVGTCLPVAGELFFGVEYSATRDENLKRLLHVLNGIRCWPFDPFAAREYGRIAAELKRSGRVIQQIDIQIAAIGRTLSDCTVVSSDGDFRAGPGLKVENWAS